MSNGPSSKLLKTLLVCYWLLFDGGQVGEKYRCVSGVKKSEDINVLPSSEYLLDDIAARNQRMVVEGLQSSHLFLSTVSVDVQKLKTVTLAIEAFFGVY